MIEGILEKLFGSPARVKIIRLFLLNADSFFTLGDISRRIKVGLPATRKEIALLKTIGFIKQSEEKIEQIIKLKKGKTKTEKKKILGFRLNILFPFLKPLKNLMVDTVPVDNEKLVKMLNSTGKIKLVVLSGIFIQEENARTDLLLVGDAIKKTALDRILKKIESEIGKELIYAVFNTSDFMYRLEMYDKFIRDILDYPHEKALNKLNIE